MTVAWDWVDGAAMAYALVATYCLTRAAQRRAWRAPMMIASAAATAMVLTYHLTVVLVPALALYFVLLNRRFAAHALGPAVACCAAGGMGVGLILGMAAVVTGEMSLVALAPPFWGLDWLEPTGSSGGSGAGPTSMAAWASLPLATMVGCVLHVTLDRPRRRGGPLAERWRGSGAASVATLLSVQYICATAPLLALHWLGRPVLATHDQAAVLIPGMMLVFGALFARILLGLSRLQYATAVVAGAALFALPWIPPVGAVLRAIVGSEAGPMSPLVPAAVICVGAAVLWLLRLSLASVVVFCLCASLANATVASVLPQDRTRWAGGMIERPQSVRIPLGVPR
jgi:hypothetical protein